MATSSRSFIGQVGHVLFPRGPQDLTDPSRCPACLAELPPHLVCSNCHLDLNHPDAGQLRLASVTAAEALDARLELIGKIRFETAARHVTVEPELNSRETASIATSATTTLQSPSQDDDANDHEVMPARSHSGVQVILLIVGVSLLSVGAIFFLVYAFISFGLIWRSMIIASITIASIIGAIIVKRRGLSATAEALSALAVVLVVLDIYALRANDLFMTGDLAGRMYWGGALLIAALGFMFWHRATGLALVNVVGYAVLPPAAALFVAGAITDRGLDSVTLAIMAALAAASLIHVTAAHDNYRAIIERIVTVTYAMLALVVALFSTLWERLLFLDSQFGVWLIVIGVIAAIHSAAAHHSCLPVAIRNSFATASGVLVAAAMWTLIADAVIGDEYAMIPVTLDLTVVGSLVALALLAETSGRSLNVAARSAMFWGSIGVWFVTAFAIIAPLAKSLIIAVQFVDQQYSRRITPGSATFNALDEGWPQLAILIIPVALALAWWATGQLRDRIHLVIASTGIALALNAPLTGTLLSAAVTWLALTAIALIIIAIDRKRRGPRTAHFTISAGGILTLTLAYASAWSSYETWLFTSIITGILLITARYLVDVAAVRTALLGTATLVFLAAAGGIGEQLQFALTSGRPNQLESWLTVSIVAVLVLARSLWSRPRDLNDQERRVLWWIGFSITVLAGANLWNASVSGAPFLGAPVVLNLHLISFVVAVILVAALSLSMLPAISLSGRARTHTVRRITAAIVLAPAVVWALDSAGRTLGLGAIAVDLAPATASVLVSALSMTLRVRKQHTLMRRVSELSALAVAGFTSVSAIIHPHQGHWLIALFVSITLLLASISADGIFGSQSLRRHALWAAVAFGTWSLWLRLDQSRVNALEAYVLPLAAIVVVIAVLTARAELHETRLRSAPYIALVGLLIAIVPLSLNAASGTGLRTLVIAGLCGALLLIAAFVAPLPRLVAFWGIAIIASATGLVVATTSRTLYSIDNTPSSVPEVDSWLVGAVALIALASFGLVSSGFFQAAAKTLWEITSEALLGTAIVLLFAVESVVMLSVGGRGSAFNDARIIALVALGGTLLVLSNRVIAAPLTHRMSYLAFGLATLLGFTALTANLVRPIEWVTVLLGLALLAHGAARLGRDATARSVKWLTPGLLVALIPSLIATFTDTESADTQWRIIVLGIACVLAIVVGSWAKLQAPLLVGTIIVLIHAAHTFTPALVAIYQLTAWWVWAVVGGAIVLFLGITLERRIRDLTTLNAKFSALR